ncbi:helix-turn-helix transcriptional regulator [Profundibacter sp.]
MIAKHLEQIFEAETIDEVWAIHTAKMATYQFDRLLYAYTRFKISASMADPLDTLILSNHPPAYVEGFVNDQHYLNGPMLRWTLENDGACSWSWLAEMESEDNLTDGERKAMEFNRDMGVIAGYTIAFKSDSKRTRGGTGLTAKAGLSQDDVDAIWARHGSEIQVMNNVMHLKISSLPYSSARRSLTSRQREVLEWVGEGKTMQDIATIMGLTAATVEKHLRLARESLDVDTTAQAVLKASYQNQIFILEV